MSLIRRHPAIAAVLAVILLGAGSWFALTSFAPGPWVATWAPCPRNWGWIPAWMPRASPLRSLSFPLASGEVKVCYGSPSLRGRTMIGGAAVPYGELWRTGANEPTTIHSDQAFSIGPLHVPAGSYALYSVPGPEIWQIVVNSSTRQWGLESEYTPAIAAREVDRFDVPVETLSTPVESFRIRVDEEPQGLSGVADLILEWQTSRVRLRLAG